MPAMAARAAEKFFNMARLPPFFFKWRIEGDVPRSRGLGSSVTVRLGTVFALNQLAGEPLTREELFALCTQLEGHPDNAAPAVFGGFTVAAGEKNPQRFDVSTDLRFVLLIPPFEVSTPKARALLPATVEHPLAVRSCANACRITAAFAAANYDLLRGAFVDHLHQPWRAPLIPFLDLVIRAGEEAGALGGFLSGSGSTITCVTLNRGSLVASAMLAAAPPGSRTIIAGADNAGARILS